MAVAYKDYYKILGVERSASQDEIQSAFRKLARTYHPDVNKERSAEEKFKDVNEAYEVLGNPDNRKKYDQLGMNWEMGDNFSPPPGWQHFSGGGGSEWRTNGGSNGFGFDFEGDGSSGFSDFFEAIFGGFGRTANRGPGRGFSSRAHTPPQAGRDHEAELTISLEEAYAGGKKTVSLTAMEPGPGGSRNTTKSYQVTIPKGVTDGRKLRLPGQGGKSPSGTRSGDLYLTVRIAKHPRFTVRGKDVETIVPVTPWEAALGETITLPLVSGSAEITLPAGIKSGKKLRIKGKGLGNPKTGFGDLFALIQIQVPEKLSAKERDLFSELSRISSYNPRSSR